MVSSRKLFFLSLCFINYFTSTIAQLQLQYSNCYDGKYPASSIYEANLNHLLNSPTNITSINYGFFNSSYGETEKVHASALCRPDMEPDGCADCIKVAKQNLSSLCPDSRLAIGGYDDRGFNNCMFRYADYDTLQVMENRPYFFVDSRSDITGNVEEFNQTRKSLLDKLITEVAGSDSPNKYATGEQAVSDIETIYALVQCTPGIDGTGCNNCLIYATSLMQNCCDTKTGGRVITPSCNFRYETNNKFYKTSIEGPPAFSPAPSTNTTTPEGTIEGPPAFSPTPSTNNRTPEGTIEGPPAFSPTPSTNNTTPEGTIEGPSAFSPTSSNNTTTPDGTIEGPPAFSPTPSTNTTTPEGKKNNTVIIIVVASAVTFVILLIIGIGIFLRWRISEEKYENKEENIETEALQFNFSTIKIATDNFSNRLGRGGFGAVYKGKLSDGQEVAVKRLSINSGQGEAEFKNEVQLLAKLQHRNLVRLLGFCLERKERILVYEFAEHSSLDHFIFDPINRERMGRESHYKIIVGIARGLLYLHEDSRLKIIHRDLKASNILLDSEMNPKISDFGLARLFKTDQTQISASKIAGTVGHTAPEYLKHGRLSVKSDVYSFGIIIFEIVTGQERSHFRSEEESDDLLTFTWKSWRAGTTLNLIDRALSGGSTAEMIKCIHIGLLCVQETESDRPTMNRVVTMLNGEFLNLPAPSKPGFYVQSSVNRPRSENVVHSQNAVSITELNPR